MSGATAVRSRWIISARDDLVWLQGSVLIGVALLLVFWWAPPLAMKTPGAFHPAVMALLVWGVLFDGTHVMGTYARTYFARDATSRAGLPPARSFAVVAVGPAVAVLDYVLFREAGLGGPLFRWFLLGASLWAYWHLVRQHWGFVALYRRRAVAETTSAVVDQAILWAGCLYPFVRFSLTPAFAATGLPVLLPAPALPVARAILDGAAVLAALAAVVWMVRHRRSLGPKHLLMAIVIGFHVTVFGLLTELLPITATLTIFHNLQYHRIVWQYERGQGRRPLGGLVPYLLAGLALGLVWYLPRVVGGTLAPSPLVRNVCLGFGWGLAFHHYLVDGRIWKVRRNPGIGRAIDAAAPPTVKGAAAA